VRGQKAVENEPVKLKSATSSRSKPDRPSVNAESLHRLLLGMRDAVSFVSVSSARQRESRQREFRGTSRFEVIRRIGAGGMGVVYEALDKDKQQEGRAEDASLALAERPSSASRTSFARCKTSRTRTS